MLKTVPKENTRRGLSSELSLLTRGKKNKATATKDAEMIIARGRAMKTLTRTTITKEGGGLQVKKINCSADSISPEVRRNVCTQEKSASCLQDVAMLALSYPVLGMSPRTGELRQGALRRKEGAEGLGEILTTRIRPEGLDIGGELSVDHGSKGTIVRQKLAAVMHKINPSKTSAVIHKNNIISIATLRNKMCKTPYIRVNKFKRRRGARYTGQIRML